MLIVMILICNNAVTEKVYCINTLLAFVAPDVFELNVNTQIQKLVHFRSE